MICPGTTYVYKTYTLENDRMNAFARYLTLIGFLHSAMLELPDGRQVWKST